MAYTLGNALADTFHALGLSRSALVNSTCITTTVVNTKFTNSSWGFRDGDFKDGTIWILEAGGAAPEGQFQPLDKFNESSGTFTTVSAFTAAPEDGDTFGVAKNVIPTRDMVNIVNAALRKLGDVPLVDKTTLDTATNTTQYACAVAWKSKPTQIDVQNRTEQAGDLDWITWHDWYYEPAAAGSTGLIIFKRQPTASRDIRVWYRDKHARVNDYDDVINEAFTPELVVTACRLEALEWLHGQGEDMERLLNYTNPKYNEAFALNPVKRSRRKCRLMIVK